TFRSLDQHGLPPSARVPIDPIEGLHLLRVRLVARFALLIVAFAVGARFIRQRCGTRRRDRGARAQRAQEFTTAERCFAFSFHSRLPPLASSVAPRCSRRQRESFGLDSYEHPAKRSYSPVEIRGIGLFEIGEKATDPGREMLLEHL